MIQVLVYIVTVSTHSLFDPPYIPIEFTFPIRFFLLSRLGQFAARREEEQYSLDWLRYELEELRV